MDWTDDSTAGELVGWKAVVLVERMVSSVAGSWAIELDGRKVVLLGSSKVG